MNSLDSITQKLPCENGIVLFSAARPFEHPEDQYDDQYRVDLLTNETLRRESRAILDRCMERGFDASRPVLEIGCGTGRLSIGLAQEERIRELLTTDPSPEFCAIVKRKLDLLPRRDHIRIGLLAAEDLGHLPDNFFSLIILRSTLHHILDVPSFIKTCSKKLAATGLLVLEEPCYEGYVLMGAINQFLPIVLRSAGVELDAGTMNAIRAMTDTMQFYARRDIDKSFAEDKHLFRVDELMRLGADCGLNLDLFPNQTFPKLERPDEPNPPGYFFDFYCDYLQYAMSWDEKLVRLVRDCMAEYFDYFRPLAPGNAMPYCYGSFILSKQPRRATS